jgi:DNA-binding XRE family transcriptional regulator
MGRGKWRGERGGYTFNLWIDRLCRAVIGLVARARVQSTERKADPELVAFGARLRALRLGAGLTQEQLADQADLHWTYVGQIERGERNLTYKNVLKLARGLGVKAAALVE